MLDSLSQYMKPYVGESDIDKDALLRMLKRHLKQNGYSNGYFLNFKHGTHEK